MLRLVACFLVSDRGMQWVQTDRLWLICRRMHWVQVDLIFVSDHRMHWVQTDRLLSIGRRMHWVQTDQIFVGDRWMHWVQTDRPFVGDHRVQWVQADWPWSIDTGCIESIAIDATGCDWSASSLTMATVVAVIRCDRRWSASSWLRSSLLERTIVTLIVLLLCSNSVTFLDSASDSSSWFLLLDSSLDLDSSCKLYPCKLLESYLHSSFLYFLASLK
jgi:hypothetical protein